jgi:hypothetical protein
MTGPHADFGDHGDWDALAVGWALSTLEPDDEARLAAHLPDCARCAETVREAVWTVTDLAYAVPTETPPRRLKRQILDLAAAEPRRPPAADPGADLHSVPAEELVAPVSQVAVNGRSSAQVVPLAPRRRRWIARTAVAAGVALIAALGAWNVQLRSEQDDLRRFVAERDELVQRLTEPGEADIAVIKEIGTGDRKATVVVKDGRVSLITEDLPRREGNGTYWLWSAPAGADPVPLAGLNVPATRLSACNVELPAGVDTRAFAISAEPGPERPARPTQLVGQGLTLIDG